MLVVLLVPVVLLIVACLLDRFERHMIVERPVAPTPAAATWPNKPVASVVALRAGPSIDGDTVPLARAS